MARSTCINSTPNMRSFRVVIILDPCYFPKQPSLHQCEQRLAFLDDVGGQLTAGAAADVFRRVDRSGGNEENIAGLERHRRLVLDLILERACEDIDDLFARMRMLAERHAGRKIDAHLDGLASGGAEIVPLQVGTLDARLLRLRRRQRQTACDNQRRQSHASNRLHVNLPLSFRYASVNSRRASRCSNWQRLAGLLAGDVAGGPVRPARIVLAAVPLLVLALRGRGTPERGGKVKRRGEAPAVRIEGPA